MKASVKVREGQRPLVRAKVPVQVGGLPFYSGITVGDEKELALHVGTNMEAGPACSLSYRPNDPQSPLAVLLKTGFGLWGSPHAAPFTISAEFNVARRENVSFMLRLKPRVGSFSVRKHVTSTSGSFGRDNGVGVRDSSHGVKQDDMAVQEEVEVAAADRPGEAISRPPGGQTQGDGLVYDTDYECGLSPLGLGQVSGLRVREKKCYMPCEPGEPGSPGSNIELHHVGDGSGELEMSGMPESSTGAIDLVSQRSFGDTDRAAAALDTIGLVDGGATLSGRADQPETRRNRLLQSWSGHAHHSWGLTVHSAIPLGRQAMARVQWGMRMPSRSGDDVGGSFRGYKLPVLVLDKISISTADPRRKAQSSAFPSDKGPLSYGMRYFENPADDGSQLGMIASTCCYMRNQLQSLHLDNRSLKKTIEDMKAEMGQTIWGEKRPSPKPPSRSAQEEDSIRSQLFEELQKKTGSRASPKDRLSSSGVLDAQNSESIFDLPSEGLLSDKKSGDLGAKAKAK
ncbi:hypothetical protein M758_1G022200 [Ceratodon purpureus]|nr:hypothetical protein M758_1G022200 [Ceratodon purpureus]